MTACSRAAARRCMLGQPKSCTKAHRQEPEALAHHFTEAGLNDLGIEWWGKAGDQALRRSAFKEAIAHLGKAIEMADKGGGDTAGAAPIRQRLKLQTDYARAIAWSRGYAADETKAAGARVQELVSGTTISQSASTPTTSRSRRTC